MRVLLLHCDDNPTVLARARPWDLVIDLGNGGPSFYEQISKLRGCPAQAISKASFSELARIASVFETGVGQLVDDFGFDWWGLLSIRFYEQLLQLFTLRRLVESYPAKAEFFTANRNFPSQVLRVLCPNRVHEFDKPSVIPQRLLHTARRSLKLRPHQVLEVLSDKYDGDYRLRRMLPRRKKHCREAVVLLPSAYENASRTALAYASVVPDVKFLLVATRKNAWLKNSQDNIAQSRLANYALGKECQAEFRRLLISWTRLVLDFNDCPELSTLAKAGCFDSMPHLLKQGLAVRDAWFNVFDSEPVSAVLCADEMNWNTRLPLLIAQSRGMPAIACHHGAFDVRYSFQRTNADKLLVKGEMEWNYLVEVCKAPPDKIEIAAPPPRHAVSPANRRLRKSIIFFSEPYENFGGRCRAFYGEILPRLADIAQQYECKLVLKLHPYESRGERSHLAKDILPKRQHKLLRVVDGALRQELLEETWFGTTISSTAALDGALSGVPMFLCEWLETSCAKYSQQFIKFGAAQGLHSAESISNIPPLLAAYSPVDRKQVWAQIEPDRLKALLFRNTREPAHNCGPAMAERAWAQELC